MKNKLATVLLVFSALYNAPLFSADIYWVKMKPNFSYKDLSNYCATYMNSNQLFLAMEASQGKVTRAIFRKNLTFAWESLELSKQEALSIQLKVTTENQASIEEMELNAASLTWVLSYGGGGEMGCRPSHPILSITPDLFTFKFGGHPDSLRNAKDLFSNSGKFSGKLKNGDSFYSELQFLQSPL